MRLRRAVWLTAAVASAAGFGTSDLDAQRLDRRANVPAEQPPGVPGIEQQFRERLAQVVKNRLNLDEAQMQQLRQVNARVERQRAQLLREERQVRMTLRSQVLAGDSADQPRVAQLLDEALRIQRRRLDLVEAEQRALSGFMTPVQRAQYFAIQDELRRRLEDIRQQRQQQRRGGMPPGGARPPLPE